MCVCVCVCVNNLFITYAESETFAKQKTLLAFIKQFHEIKVQTEL